MEIPTKDQFTRVQLSTKICQPLYFIKHTSLPCKSVINVSFRPTHLKMLQKLKRKVWYIYKQVKSAGMYLALTGFLYKKWEKLSTVYKLHNCITQKVLSATEVLFGKM